MDALLSMLPLSAVSLASTWLTEAVLNKWQAARGTTFRGAPVPAMTKDRTVAVFHVSPLQDGYSLGGGTSMAQILSSGGLQKAIPAVCRVESHPARERGPGYLSVVCYRAPGASRRAWVMSVEKVGILFSPWRQRRERRMRIVFGIAQSLAALAGPGQEAWLIEWPAHLAGIEPSWNRPARIAWHTAGFARAAILWRLSHALRRPVGFLGRAVDGFLRSDALCTLAIVSAVAVTTRWSDQAAGPAAAATVFIASTASALTAVNQARKFRGIKKPRRTDKPAAK
jgi:hypothetical protein